MKQNQRGRHNGRYNNTGRGARPQTILRNTSLESSGPCGKLHGTALQLFEKYQAAAKDAQIQNDDVLAETCLQYADHYMHLQNIAIANEQAMRMQQQQRAALQETASSSELSAEEAVREITEKASEKVLEKTASSEGELKVLDLSVPVKEMAANHNPAESAEKEDAPSNDGVCVMNQVSSERKRRILRPKSAGKKAEAVQPVEA